MHCKWWSLRYCCGSVTKIFIEVLKIIGVGAGTFLMTRRILARIFPNLPEKFLCYFCLQLFSHKYHKDLFLVWHSQKVVMCFSANNGLHFLKWNNVGRHFCLDFQGFCSDFLIFVHIFRDFARIYDKSELWRCACTSACYTTAQNINPINNNSVLLFCFEYLW